MGTYSAIAQDTSMFTIDITSTDLSIDILRDLLLIIVTCITDHTGTTMEEAMLPLEKHTETTDIIEGITSIEMIKELPEGQTILEDMETITEEAIEALLDTMITEKAIRLVVPTVTQKEGMVLAEQ